MSSILDIYSKVLKEQGFSMQEDQMFVKGYSTIRLSPGIKDQDLSYMIASTMKNEKDSMLEIFFRLKILRQGLT